MRLASFQICGLLLMAACASEAAAPDPSSMASEKAPDAGQGRTLDAGSLHDAAAGSCPATDPKSGTACAGELRCKLRFHGDCKGPSCPAGCKFLGLKPGAALTSSMAYYAVCQDGVWTQTSEGDCSVNQSAAMCECAGQDAGTF